MLANVIIHFLPLNNASTADASNKSEQVQTDNSENVSNEVSDGDADTPVSAEVENNNQSSEVSQGTINTSFMAIQCGYFAQEDNAKEAFNKIASGYGAFIYNDADKFKVLAGIYTADEGQAVIDKLTSSGIECAKVEFNLNSSNAIESQIAGIYDGYLEILDTAFKDDEKDEYNQNKEEYIEDIKREDLNKEENNDESSLFKDEYVSSFFFYRIREKETVSDIATKFKVNKDTLLAANPKKSFLPNELILIPR